MMNKKTNKGFARVTWALVLALIWAICLSCVSMAAAAETFDQTLEITQSIKGEVQRSKYTYQLTPVTENAPLPEGAKNGVYEFALEGEEGIKLGLTFPADVAADYKYELTRLEAVPAGDTVTPDTHIFGYLVQKDDDGNWVIIPYTCYNKEFKIWDKVDADGNPLGVTLVNMITGKETTTSTTTTTTTNKNTTGTTRYGVSTRTVTRTHVVTNTVARVVNTGDPFQVGLWVVLIVLSLAALIIIAAVRRKKEKDEEDS